MATASAPTCARRPTARSSPTAATRPKSSTPPASPAIRTGSWTTGVPALHRDFRDCIREGREPLTSIHDVVHSMRLLEQVARLDPDGQPLEAGD